MKALTSLSETKSPSRAASSLRIRSRTNSAATWSGRPICRASAGENCPPLCSW